MRVTRGNVALVFGCFGARRLPGPVLVTALTDLGMSPAAARALIARMTRDRRLRASRRGAVTVYELDDAMRRDFLRIRYGDASPPWEGHFDAVIYDVPESRRADRDGLRAAAAEGGFAPLRPGLLIGFEPAAAWLEPFRRHRPRSGFIEVGQLACDVPTARRLTRRAWNLDKAAATMREHTASVAATVEAVRGAPPSGAQALRTLSGVMTLSTRHRLLTPALPAELRPARWPADDLHAAIQRLTALLFTEIAAYVYDTLAASPHACLVEADPSADEVRAAARRALADLRDSAQAPGPRGGCDGPATTVRQP